MLLPRRWESGEDGETNPHIEGETGSLLCRNLTFVK